MLNMHVEWRHRLGLFALCVLVLGSALGSRDPWHIDEVRFVGVALEMLQRGDFWVPHRAGEIYADKPPIFFWTLAALFKLSGSVRWTFLLPAFISGAITAQLVYDLGSRLWNRRIGLLAGVLLICSYQFWRSCTYANIDGFLLMWPTLGVYGFMRHLLSGRDLRWFLLGFVAVAVGILSKGVGFLPLLLALPYAIARSRLGNSALTFRAAHIPARHWLGGFALLLALLAAWLLPLVWMAQHDTGDLRAYLDNILFRQTAGRYANAWQHREPAWFFLAAIPKYWAPISLLLPWLLPMWWRRLRRGDSRYILLLGWVALVLAFFSASTGKREIYMLPALPALALIAAPAWYLLLRQRWLQRAATLLMAVLMLLPALAGTLRLVHALPRSPLNQLPDAGAWILIALSISGLLLAILLRRHSPMLRCLAIYLISIACFHKGLMPLMNAVESGRPAIVALSAAAAPGPVLLQQWDERVWLYSRVALVHNGISTGMPECTAALWAQQHPQQLWLVREPAAVKFGLDTRGPTFDSGDKQRWLLAQPARQSVQQQADCEHAELPHYQFAWEAAALSRLGN